MKISEFIQELQKIQDEHGDLETQSWSINGSRIDTGFPQVAFKKILVGKETRPRFWSSYDGEEQRGDKVCRI